MTDTKQLTFASRDDLDRLIKRNHNGRHRGQVLHLINPEEAAPWGDLGFPEETVDVNTYHISPHSMWEYRRWNHRTQEEEKTSKYPLLLKSPVYVSARYNYRRQSKKFAVSSELQKVLATAKDHELIIYDAEEPYSRWDNSSMGWGNVLCTVEQDGRRLYLALAWPIAEHLFDLKFTDNFDIVGKDGIEFKMPKDWTKRLLENLSFGDWRNRQTKFNYTLEAVSSIHNNLPMNRKNMERFLEGVVNKGNYPVPEIKPAGTKKTMDRLQPFVDELLESDPLTFCCYRSFASQCKRSVDGVKVSTVFNEVFKDCESAADITKALKDFYENKDGYSAEVDDGVRNLPTYKDKRRAVLKSQANRAFTKVMQEAESLTIDKSKCKRTWQAIEDGDLPIGIFFRKSEQYYLLNDNWHLWEEMFKRGYGDVACEIARDAAGRTTYEKDLMSYFYCVLYGLPEYLKKHTGKKWEVKPKFVNSANELEPPKEGDDGVARSRSALTPIADNDNMTVEVPYASIRIHSRQTQYCYSHDYHVLQKGFSFHGNAVSQDLEKRLNGRDDYGLMFYTLTGSHNARGYPTFLIIFERRDRFNDTRVHFHRTHPSRSKDGDYNPIHNWTKVCYNWMCGNIKRDRIVAQQGDLAFVKIKTDKNDDSLDGAAVTGLEFNHEVDQYDNHCFAEPVAFAEYTKKAKSNILGYVKLDKQVELRHNEHDNEQIPAGTYAIHQARSWEANPRGVWTLNID